MFAENLANKLIGLLVTVGILAAVYFFAIKPVLDTTENAFNSIDGTVDNAFEEFGVNGFDVDEIVDGNIADVQKQIRDANLGNAQQRQAERLVACIQRVQPNTAKMQDCVDRFQ
jgi:hypothetical protein